MHHIIEVANTHGGSMEYIKSLIDEYSEFRNGYGIKFQAFKADLTATPDFEWYPVYKELYFNTDEWCEILTLAAETKNIWMEVCDSYSIQLIKKHSDIIFGLKFQACTLNNYPLFNEISKLDLSKNVIMLNIAGYDIEQIEGILDRVSSQLNPKYIILEAGFQAYPTELQDSGISKIKTLKNKFGNKLAFADHSDGKSDDAINLPLIASMLGVDIIEKHVMHSSLKTKYDHYSSITIDTYRDMVQKIAAYKNALNQPFINQKETNIQLGMALQRPILKRHLPAGSIPSIENDFTFKRTPQEGLNVYEIQDLVRESRTLIRDMPTNSTLRIDDFSNS